MEDIDKQLDVTVPMATELTNNIRNLWLMVETEEQDELVACMEQARRIEEKLRKIARSLQDKQNSKGSV